MSALHSPRPFEGLEVAPSNEQQATAEKQVVLSPTSDAPEAHGKTKDENHPLAFVVHQAPAATDSGAKAGRRRICRLSPLAFWVLTAVSILLVLAAIAGVVGGLLTNKSTESPASNAQASVTTTMTTEPTASPSATPPANSISRSQLAAANWTDSSGRSRKAVFYQQNGKIIMRRVDPSTGVWTQVDIDAQFPNGLDAKNGTALAVDASPPGLTGVDPGYRVDARLYYRDTSNHIRDIVSSDDDFAFWKKGPFWGLTVPTYANSQLAVLGHWCNNVCMNKRILVYQVEGGGMVYKDGRDFSAPAVHINSVSPGTPMAMLQTPWKATESWTNRSQIRLYYHRGSGLQEYQFNKDKALAWQFGRGLAGSGSSVPLSLVAAPSKSNSLGVVTCNKGTDITVGFLGKDDADFNSDSTNLTATFLNDDGTQTRAQPRLGLRALAMTQSYALYGITQDGTQILEYGWGNVQPHILQYTATVLQL